MPTHPYLDPAVHPLDRAADLVSRMTLEEKVSQMVHDAAPIERLHVLAYNWWNECLHGVARAGIATVFPQAIGLAATWDTDLMRRVAVVIGDEARAKHHEFLRRGVRAMYSGLTFWTPNINIFRDPRWGRGQETYGEDPFLAARMGVTFVAALQGDDETYLKLVATPKHFAVHSGPETLRHRFNAVVSERDLRETYLPAFEACVVEAGAQSVMGAYNRTNDEPCCASQTLLGNILRDEWGFDGYVVSDCWAIGDLYKHHKVVETKEQAAALAVRNGCDLNCGEAYLGLLDAVAQGLLAEGEIDLAVTRLMAARIRLGMSDPPERVPYAAIPYTIVDSPEHRALAREAAAASIVLLKNDGVLPLSRAIKSVALIGPFAQDEDVLLGNYNGLPSAVVTFAGGVRGALPPDVEVLTAEGCAIAEGWPALTPVPSAFLQPAGPCGSATTVHGLRGVYFSNPLFLRPEVAEHTDSQVDFRWKDRAPLPGLQDARYGVVWSGCLVPPVSGDYRLGFQAAGIFTVTLDGEVVLKGDNDHHVMTFVRDVTLEAGRAYDLQIRYVKGIHEGTARLLWAPPGQEAVQLARALETARRADVIVACLGLSATVEGEEMHVVAEGFYKGDRTEIELPKPQQTLLEQLVGLGKPVVLVLTGGGAIAIPWAAEHVRAILNAWYPGEEGGAALAGVLFGDTNPAGRLPVTLYRSTSDLPPFEDYGLLEGGGQGRTYRFFRGKPLYPFGHGLSYTSFAYGDVRIEPGEIDAAGTAMVSVDVKNTGERAGDEVVQLYVRYLESQIPRPLKELKAFERIHLAPGETKAVAFSLPARSLAYWNGEWTVEPGRVGVLVGASSADLRSCGELYLRGLPDREG